jgi:hypothetical protein
MANLKNPVKAIRAHCIDCSGGSLKEVSVCPMTECPLYPFRLGKNTFRKVIKKELTDEQRAELADRLKKARNKKKEN